MAQITPETHFLKDTNEFLEKLNALFLLFEAGSVTQDSLEEAFRCLHSIKSEASYLEYNKISSLAHKGEGILNDLRIKGEKPKSHTLDELFIITSGIEELLRQINIESQVEDTESVTKAQKKSGVDTKNTGFTIIERELLSEAKDRNEYLYRVECQFVGNMPMKYPRAFLILNNLEQLVTVIRTNPELYLKQEDFETLTIFFTCGSMCEEIQDVFNVDGISKVYFAKIPWNLIFKNKFEPHEQVKSDRKLQHVSVSVEKLDTMLGDLHSLKMKIFQQFPQYSQELEKVEKNLKEFRLVNLEKEFNRYTVFIRNTSRDLEKEVSFSYSGGDIKLDKNILEQLSDPIMQLVRNALVHGIESPDDRNSVGKNPEGKITLLAQKEGKGLIIEVRDDGRGIDEAHIRDLAKQTGLFAASIEDLSLLDLLSTQGFSTAPQISGYAGRGIGLDVVMQKIQEIPGAKLSLDNIPGEGICFSIHIPYAVSLVGIHLFSYSDKFFGIFADAINQPEKLNNADFSNGPDQGVYYKGMPVYTIFGRLYLIDKTPSSGVIIPMIINDEDAVLLADKDISIEDLPYDQLHIIETQLPNLFDVFIGNRKVPYVIYKSK